MWIKTSALLCCVVAVALAADEHRPKKKDEARGKRNLQYISHHYNGPHAYRLERRISTGSQIPQFYHSQFFPGPRSHSPYHKGRPHSLPPPPYAVQMEPLVQYSQRDPLYDTNALSLHTDSHNEDLLTDNNHLTENVYGPQQQIIERPVYIKEPEPIIEIIIKESNVTLPAPPPPPPLPPKKKEQVQVFYVKYKKNPNGHGKDSVIYDKPVAAISPPIHDEHEEEPPQEYHHHHHHEAVTGPPPPSTTLRTIIHPESETYHSPSGVKVTFGKEGFDYDKRSNKPEDLNAASGDHHSVQFPQGRQLSSFPSSAPRRPSNYNFNAPPSFRSEPQRQPQPYRPFNYQPTQFRQPPNNFPRPNPAPQQYSTLPKYLQVSQQQKSAPPPPPQFPPPRPVPPQFHQQSNPQRQPVPYQPFESLRQPQEQQQFQFRPQTHFPVNPQPVITQQKAPALNKFNQQIPQNSQQQSYQNQEILRQQQSKQEDGQRQLYQQQQLLLRPVQHQQARQQPVQHLPQQISPQAQHQQTISQQYHQQHTQNIVPPGGELIAALPKFEQHISVLEPNQGQQPQALPLQNPQLSHQEPQQQFNRQNQQHESQTQYNNQQFDQHRVQQAQHSPLNHLSQAEYNERIQQQLREANALQESIRSSSPHQQQEYFKIQQSLQQQQQQQQQPNNNPIFYQTSTARSTTQYTTPRSTSTTTQASTTQEPEKVSTTTKDPKLLNAQLPDEVPDDLREQLLASGILNHADISILDYDKVGDIPLSALPPDQLANFYNAGGAQQIGGAGSEPIPSILTPEGSPVDKYEDEDVEASETHEVRAKPEVQMKVVHYDPQTERGQRVQESYVKEDATQVDPVVLNDQNYNRYLPLKVSGTQFPIPDVPELKGKKITSVVVLAPVTYDFSSKRKTREAKKTDIEFIEEPALKELLKNPTLENYKKFFDIENKTRSDKQAVILLVTGPNENNKEKEIYMYDIATQTVNKLSGELSAAFVEAAEANATEDAEETKVSASNIVETRVPYTKNYNAVPLVDEELENSASDFVESRVPIIDPMDDDLESEASEHLERFVDISGLPVQYDLTAAASETSKTGLSLPSS